MGVNLRVQIGRISMKNPVMTASGTCGYGPELADYFDLSRLGAFTAKGTSLVPWTGNPYPRTAEVDSGMLNAIGLQNPGIEVFVNEKLPFLRQFDVPVIVNIVGHSIAEYAELAARLDKVEGIAALEINISCPNDDKCMIFGATPESTWEVVSAVREKTSLMLITKLSPNTGDIVSIARAARDAGSDAVSLINTLMGIAIDAKSGKFKLAKITGGLSGPPIKPVALRMVYQVAQANLGVPIIGMGGIENAEDAIEFLRVGANAVAVGTATLVNPKATVEIADGIETFLNENGIADVNELVGAVKIGG